jgi:hypothetical protein
VSSSQVLARATIPQIPDFWKVFGHSWFQFQTGPSGDQTGRVDGLVRSAMDIEFNNWRNYAISGARAQANGRSIGGWSRVVANMVPAPTRTAGPFAPDLGATLICYGINDLGWYGGQTAAVRDSYIASMRAIISRCRASIVYEDNNVPTSQFSYGAGWTNLASGADLSSGGTTRQCTTTTTATITFTIPSTYQGEPIAWAFLLRPGATGGTVTFSGTAGVTGTFYTGGGGQSGTEHAYTVRRITNLTSANAGQTIIATTTALDATSPSLFFDCVWLESLTPPPVIVCNIAKLTAAGYGNSLYVNWTGTEGSKDGDVDTTNASLRTLVGEFDGMVQIADVDTAISKNAAYTSDGIHPNELGSGGVVDAILDARDRLVRPAGSFGRSLSFNGPSPRTSAQRRPRRASFWATADFSTYSTFTVASGAVVGQAFALPFQITESRDRWTQISTEVSTAATTQPTVRWGVYDDINWEGYPQQLISITDPTSSTAFGFGTTTGLKNQSFSFTWPSDPGLYWLVMKFDTLGVACVLRSLAGQSPFMPNRPTGGTSNALHQGWSVTGLSTTALPGSFPTGGTLSTNVPLIQLLKA